MNTTSRRQDESTKSVRMQKEEEQHRLLIQELHDQQQIRLEQYTYSSDHSEQFPSQVYTRGTTGSVTVRTGKTISETISSTNTTPITSTRKQVPRQQIQQQQVIDSISVASGSAGNISFPVTPPLSGRSGKSRSSRSLASTPTSCSSRSMSQPRSKNSNNETSKNKVSNNRHSRSRSQEAMMGLFDSNDDKRGRTRNLNQSQRNRGASRDMLFPDVDDNNSNSSSTNNNSTKTSDRNIFRRSRSQVLSADNPRRHRRKDSRDTIDGNAKYSSTASRRSTVKYSNHGNDSSTDQQQQQKQQQHSAISSITPHFPVEYRDVTPSVYKEKLESNTSTTNRSTRSSVNGQVGSGGTNIVRDSSGSSSSQQTRELLKAHSKMSRRVVDELNRAQGSEKNRIPAVTNACAVFDHDDEARHNIELYYGAALALAKFFIVATKDDEIRMILSALEMVFRGSPKQCADAFGKVSHSLLSNLLRTLERFETRNVKHADVSILNISKILYYLSRSTELRSMLCRPKAMLQTMSRLSTRALNPECRVLWVRITANLANMDDNKVIMYEQDGIVDSLLRVGHFDSSDLVRQLAMTALMEFSSAPSNHTSMAKNEVLVSTVVKAVLVEKNAATRESAITTLQNLAFAKENRVKLVSLKNGIVLEALKKALAHDADAKARRRAAGALTNLACEETAEIMGMNKGLVQTLAIVATKDEKEDVQTRASLALTKIAGSVNVNMTCHETILDALVVASLSKAPNSVAAVLRVKARAPESREALARHSGVVDTLCDICVSDESQANDRDNAIRAIMHLVNEDKNRKILCNKTVLDALVIAANYTDPQLEEARDSAVRGLERLATEPSNRNFMAHHPGLIVAISKSVEREAVAQQDGRESEYGFLAKPLLLSLLVAM